MSEQKSKELFQEIGFGFLEKTASIIIIIFSLNPFINVLLMKKVNYFFLMYMYNGCVLALGFFLLAICVIKLWSSGRLPQIKELLKGHVAVALFLVFALMMIVTTLLNGAPEIAVVGDTYRGEGLLGFLSYIIYFLLATFMFPEKGKKLLIALFLISSTLVGGVIFVDYMFLGQKYNYALEGNMVLHNSNHLGYYLLMSIMFHGMIFVTAKKTPLKIAGLCGFMFMTITLIMNNTWGCQLALLIGVIFTIIVCSVGKGKFQPVTLGLLFAMIAAFVLSYFSDERLKVNIETNIMQQISEAESLFEDEVLDESMGSGRMGLWLHTLQYIGERPILGHGSDVTGERLKADAGNDRCHCEFMNYAVSFGVPTAIVYIMAVFMVYLRGLQKKEELTAINYSGLCAAFAYLASSLVGNTMYYTAPYLFIALGMGYAAKPKEESNS